ncbi:MAG: polysaccharide pyruvyl transferase family protein [Clostridia bacterium]|nr:polysaccharide pyruvyl transferase family protein [Clostridia bacterium]
MKKIITEIHILVFSVLTFFKRCFAIVFNKVKTVFRKDRVIFLIGTPEHGNMGDELIAIGEIEWLGKYYADETITEVTQSQLLSDRGCRVFLSQLKSCDILLLHGGGNLNDKYVKAEKIRRTVIKKRPHNKIVLFQQSIYYPDTEYAQKIKAETSSIYNSHKNLTVIVREDTSYRTACEMFPSLNVLEYPDMATFLFNKLSPSENFDRDGIAWCIRNDCEKYYTAENLDSVFNALSQKYSISVTDTHIGHPISIYQRRAEAQKLIDSLAHSRVVITDRFHGVVFSVLSNTPCIAIRSRDHKVTDGVKWFKESGIVLFADTIEDIPALVEKLIDLKDVRQPDFSGYFEKLYNDIKF